jgi:N-methylhydantoinase A
VRIIESGPAAGVIAAAEYGRMAGVADVLSFDMGGTTAKLTLVPGGAPMLASELEVAHLERFKRGSGFPLKIHSIQTFEIGAGGGSIAVRDQLGCCGWDRAARAPIRDRRATASAAPSPR